MSGNTDDRPVANEQGSPDVEVAPVEIALSDEELLALCKERVCSVCAEKEQADDERLRSLAEMDNFRKRMEKDKQEFMKFAAESVLADLPPVLDNLDLALAHGRKVEACKDVVMGVEMTRKLFLDALKRHGLEPVGAEGEPFNPEFHEAMGAEERADMDEGLVASLLQRGYVLKDRLLRPAKVTVSKKPE